jgi:hypothetical protein
MLIAFVARYTGACETRGGNWGQQKEGLLALHSLCLLAPRGALPCFWPHVVAHTK